MKKLRIWTVGILTVYLLLLVWMILFKGTVPYGGMFLRRSVNLIPFYIRPDASYLRPIAHRDWIVNVIAFIPLGILADLLNGRHSLWRSVLAGFGVSFLLELSQYATGFGATDVTDLITNTAGTLVGILVYRLLRRIFGERPSVLIVNLCGTLLPAVVLVLRLLLYYSNR